VLVLAAPASAATKPYSVVICAFGADESCSPSLTSAVNAPAGVPVSASIVTMTATLKNENKTGSGINLGSANLTPPAGFNVSVGANPLSGPGTAIVDASGIVELRGMGLPAGGTETLTMTVSTPAATAGCTGASGTVASPCLWGILSKQSNDFSGSPGNNLNLKTSTSTLGTVFAQLQFGAEPHNATVGASITDTDYTPPPAGGPVTVDVTDSTGAIVASYVGNVTVALVDPVTGFPGEIFGALSGDTSEPASAGGVAKFSSLQVSAPGLGYSLQASTPDLPPAAGSTAFDIQQAGAVCSSSKKSCTTAATSTNWAAGGDGAINVTVTASPGPNSPPGTPELTESVDFGAWPSSERVNVCGGASAHFTFAGLTAAPGWLLTTTITTIDLELTQSNFNASVKAQEDCLAQLSPFTALQPGSNPPVLVPATPASATNPFPDGSTTHGYMGLEPDCGSKSNQVVQGTGPCVTNRTGTLQRGGGGTLTITDSSPVDRYVN
jgi:hypothetical protein